jgi:membrane protease YdiL (CAAX protease family)
MALSVGAIWALWWPVSFVWPQFVERFVLDDDPVLLAGRTGVARVVHAVVLALAIGCIGPVIEELIFRGVLLRRWAARWGRVHAVLASSILFGLMHVDPLGSVYFGFALCTLAIGGGGVRVPIRIHALNNLLALGMGLIDEGFQLSGPPWTVEQFREQAAWALPLFAVSAVWAVWWGRRAARAVEWGGRSSK